MQIYVALLGEGIHVWRPVNAESVGADVYRILDQPYDRSIESWEFQPGEKVICDIVASDRGPILAATKKA